jgi:predicted N-formylglutamate amidohydrolase
MKYDNPFDVMNPESSVPVIFAAEHAGNRALGKVADENILKTEKAYDPGARDIATRMANDFGAFAIFGNYTRLVIDLNRDLSGLDSSEIWDIWRPYHSRIKEKISEMRVLGIIPVFISIHTMKPDWPQDIALLFDCDMRLADFLRDRFAKFLPDVVIGMNKPFNANTVKGTLTINAEPFRLPCVEIEFNQRLLSTPEKLDKCIRCMEIGICDFIRAITGI